MIRRFNIVKTIVLISMSFVMILSLFPTAMLCYAKEGTSVENWIKTDYNAENGLPTGEANAILQTQDGFIWIGSYGGLIRYDGKSFKNFSTQKGTLESSSIRALYESEDGTLYIGTNDMGVYLYRDDTFIQAAYKDGEDDFYSVRSFTETSDGTIYVGTTSGLAKLQEDDKEVTLSAVSGTAGDIIYDLACDSNDVLWACSNNGRIILVKGDTFLTEMDASLWMKDNCYSVLAGSDGFIYLGSSKNEVVRLQLKDDNYKTASFTGVCISTATLHTVNDMYEDYEGNIWVLADNGIGCIQSGQLDKEGENTALEIPSVMRDMYSVCSMIEDYEGSLWTASTKSGISYFSRGKYTNFNEAGKLENLAINAIEQYDGYSYIGTDYGLVILDRDYEPVANALTTELASKRVRHITCSKDGTLWFSLYGDGLVQYHPGQNHYQIYTTKSGLMSNQIRMTLPMSDGSIAIAESSGIDILKDGKVIRSYGEEQLPYPFILCMFEAEDGTLVAGSDGMGIYTIKDSEVKQYYQEDGLESGVVLRMALDKETKGVWVSAGNALYFWDKNGILKMPFYDGAGSVLDIQIVDDKLWLMKSNGPLVVDKKGLLEGNYEVRELSREYGLTGNLVANSWNYRAEDGSLWLCTNNGISVIHTQDLPMNGKAPKGTVTQVIVDDEVMSAAKKVTVAASAKRITLDLAVMSYTLGDKTVEYYLEGFDDKTLHCNISELSNISYTNLSGGDYVFHMTVYNEDGIKGNSYAVNIHKAYHFWELGWVKLLLIVLLVSLVAFVFQLVYRVKIKRLKKRQAEYRSIIEQSLQTFANTIDAKDKDTNGHSYRVAIYSKELARRMKLSVEEQENVYFMALLHDIGKIGIPDSILKKSGKLTAEEWEIVKSHPIIGGEILKEFTAIEGIADGAKYHHEFYNGKGYCEGLKGEEIPLNARIIAVADAFDAMCSRRYYHDGTTIEHAREEIARCSGEQFDAEVARCMLEMIDDGFMDDKMAEQ